MAINYDVEYPKLQKKLATITRQMKLLPVTEVIESVFDEERNKTEGMTREYVLYKDVLEALKVKDETH